MCIPKGTKPIDFMQNKADYEFREIKALGIYHRPFETTPRSGGTIEIPISAIDVDGGCWPEIIEYQAGELMVTLTPNLIDPSGKPLTEEEIHARGKLRSRMHRRSRAVGGVEHSQRLATIAVAAF